MTEGDSFWTLCYEELSSGEWDPIKECYDEVWTSKEEYCSADLEEAKDLYVIKKYSEHYRNVYLKEVRKSDIDFDIR